MKNNLFDNLKCVGSRPRYATADNYYGSYLIFNPRRGKLNKMLDACFYVTRSGGTCWCCAWLTPDDRNYGYGVGKASGWGYDRESAAFVSALEDMGVDTRELYDLTKKKGYGIAPGIGMNAVISDLKMVLPDSKNLVSIFVGA